MVIGTGKVRICVESLSIVTEKGPQFIDITDKVLGVVARAGVRNGLVVVFSQHTTAAIKINENEPELIKDMELFLERVSPPDGVYRHNDFEIRTTNIEEDECPNGHAHCQHLLLSTSEMIPVVDGRMQLGVWQRIFLVELDRPRPRQVLVQVIGE